MAANQTVLAELGLDEMDAESQQIFAERMAEAVFKRVVATCLERLTEEDILALEEIDAEEIEVVERFLKERINDYDEIISSSFEEYKEELRAVLGRQEEIAENINLTL